MRVLKRIAIVVGVLIALILVASVVYLIINRQGVIEGFEVKSPDLEHKILIASQGSDFKNALVDSLVKHLVQKQVYIKVIDVTALSEVDEDTWDAMVFIHTTEQWKLQPDVSAYLDRAQDLSKITLVITSGSGEWRPQDYNIDVITSASRVHEIGSIVDRIMARLNLILATEAEH
jgi:hypothetical protein